MSGTPGLLDLRRAIEGRFEARATGGDAGVVGSVPADGDIGEQLLDLVAGDDGPSTAAFLQRRASREQILDYLRERSVQQLKESDPQSFVLPRLDGAAKVALAELQYDEYGGGRPQRLHATMYGDALEAAGLDRTYGAYIDETSGLSLTCCNVMTMFGLNRRLRGAAMGHLAAFEASSSVPAARSRPASNGSGFPMRSRRTSTSTSRRTPYTSTWPRATSAARWSAEDPSLREDVLFGAASSLHLDALSGGELLDRWTTGLEQAS